MLHNALETPIHNTCMMKHKHFHSQNTSNHMHHKSSKKTQHPVYPLYKLTKQNRTPRQTTSTQATQHTYQQIPLHSTPPPPPITISTLSLGTRIVLQLRTNISPSSYLTYITSTLINTHHHSAPFAKQTHTQHNINCKHIRTVCHP